MEEERTAGGIARLTRGFPLALVSTEGAGLQFEASRHICTGEVVLRARPYAAIVCHGFKTTVCHGCFKHITRSPGRSTTVHCAACGQATFCSPVCRAQSIGNPETSHSSLECKAFKKLAKMAANSLSNTEISECRLIIRILSRRHCEVTAARKRVDALRAAAEAIETNSAQVIEVPPPPDPNKQVFSDAMALVSNSEAFRVSRPDIYERVALKTEVTMKVLHGSALVDGVTEADVQQLYCKEQCNTFGIWSPNSVMRGVAMYPVASFFNHSCSPNLVHHNTGTLLEIRALKPIPAGAPLLISYVELADDTVARRADLLWNFAFTCACPRCSSGDSRAEWAAVQRHCCRKRACVGTLGLHWPTDSGTDHDPFMECNLCFAHEIPSDEELRCTCGRPLHQPPQDQGTISN